jgi:hypothetical protein
MEPGRELDYAVLIHIFGGKHNGYDFDGDSIDQIGSYLPTFSKEISTAWEVVEKMREELFSKRRSFLSELQKQTKENGSMLAWPDVFWSVTPMTICKAALLTTKREDG